MATGFEQARSVVAAIAGDLVAADRVELDLPETGVCNSDGDMSLSPTSTIAGPCCGSSSAAALEIAEQNTKKAPCCGPGAATIAEGAKKAACCG